MKKQYILAIDQGTSGTKSLIVDDEGKVCAKGSEPLKTNYFNNGWVEQHPEEIFQNVLIAVKNCLEVFPDGPDNIVACGISNQRETFVIWDREGKPLYNAIVWQCKRSIEICERLTLQRLEQTVKAITGLLIDPYFSGTKLIWLYENNDQVRTAIDGGNAFFGTVDTWLLYKLTNGKSYLTDYTNASRTLFFNLETLTWDKELLKTFGLSMLNLPVCQASSDYFGETDFLGLLKNPIPVSAMIGDSHAAAFGNGCYTPGTAKATMGTGCSVLMNIGTKLKFSDHGMVTTICWSSKEEVHYALEGVIVSCGATIEWLKNELGIIADGKETEAIALGVVDNNGVYLVPAFSGLGAPHWDMNRRAAITGLTFSANKNHIVRAALESIPFQIKDVIRVIEADSEIRLTSLMVDGGISSNNFILQFLADLLEKPVINIGIADVSALGAAYLAGLQEKVYRDIDQLAQFQTERRISQPLSNGKIKTWYKEWQSIVANKNH